MTASPARQTAGALAGLLAVAVCWGSSFPLTKNLFPAMTAIDFVGVRFPMAGALLLLIFFRHVRRLPRRAVLHGVVLGLAYGVAQIAQTQGLEHVSASVSGFITGSYVVLTPLLAALLFRRPVGRLAWIGAVLSTTGLGFLALHGLAIGGPELLTLGSAVIYALHILGLGRWSTPDRSLGLAAVQMATVGLVCYGTAVVLDGHQPSGPPTAWGWVAVIYMVVVSGALAMVIQSWAQAHLAPTRAAIVMATEPVWAATLSALFLRDPVTWRFAVGGGLMVAAIAVVEVLPAVLAPRTPQPEPETTDPAGFFNPTGSHL